MNYGEMKEETQMLQHVSDGVEDGFVVMMIRECHVVPEVWMVVSEWQSQCEVMVVRATLRIGWWV